MSNERNRISFINATMGVLHDTCNDLYEALIDEDYESINAIIERMEYIVRDIKETLSNEI